MMIFFFLIFLFLDLTEMDTSEFRAFRPRTRYRYKLISVHFQGTFHLNFI